MGIPIYEKIIQRQSTKYLQLELFQKRESESSIRSYQIRPSDNPRHQTYE